MTTVHSSYSGKKAIVTGSRRGIGRLVTEHILKAGGVVYGFAREPTFDHPDYSHFQVDVGDPAAVQRVFMDLKKLTQRVDIVINNAAVLTSQYAMIMPPSRRGDD